MPKETYAELKYRMDLADYEKRESARLQEYEQKKARLAAEYQTETRKLEQLIAHGEGDSRYAEIVREYLEDIEHFQKQADDMWATRHRRTRPTPPSPTTQPPNRAK